MKVFRSKKAVAVLVAGAITLGGAGAALAYFTSPVLEPGTQPLAPSGRRSVVASSERRTGRGPGGPGDDNIDLHRHEQRVRARRTCRARRPLYDRRRSAMATATPAAMNDNCLVAWTMVLDKRADIWLKSAAG